MAVTNEAANTDPANPTTNNRTYAATAEPLDTQPKKRQYVQLDTTTYKDCYKVPTFAEVLYALEVSFPDDPTIKPYPLTGSKQGTIIIETQNPHMFEGKDVLTSFGVKIGTMKLCTNENRSARNGIERPPTHAPE